MRSAFRTPNRKLEWSLDGKRQDSASLLEGCSILRTNIQEWKPEDDGAPRRQGGGARFLASDSERESACPVTFRTLRNFEAAAQNGVISMRTFRPSLAAPGIFLVERLENPIMMLPCLGDLQSPGA